MNIRIVVIVLLLFCNCYQVFYTTNLKDFKELKSESFKIIRIDTLYDKETKIYQIYYKEKE